MINSVTRRVAAVAIGAAALMIVAVPAHADAADTAFINALDSMNIPYTTAHDATSSGRAVCIGLDQGYSMDTMKLAAAKGGSLLTSIRQADNFVRAAVLTYCPEHVRPQDIGWE